MLHAAVRVDCRNRMLPVLTPALAGTLGRVAHAAYLRETEACVDTGVEPEEDGFVKIERDYDEVSEPVKSLFESIAKAVFVKLAIEAGAKVEAIEP